MIHQKSYGTNAPNLPGPGDFSPPEPEPDPNSELQEVVTSVLQLPVNELLGWLHTIKIDSTNPTRISQLSHAVEQAIELIAEDIVEQK